jgi:hypothetical protein
VQVQERSRRWFPNGPAHLFASTIAVGVSILGAGCSASQPPTPAATAQPTVSTPSPPAAATPEPTLQFKPDLAASENQDYFDWVAAGVLATDQDAGGRAFIDALAAGGFDKSQMELTFDRTAVDLEADSIQFSVRLHGQCVIGQAGPGDSFHSVITAPLGTGTCLIGATRQIDW